MRVRTIIGSIALAAVALTVMSTSAHQVRKSCVGSVTKYATEAGTVYTDDHGAAPTGVPGLDEYWIYLESNNHKGLQKGGYNPVFATLAGEEMTEETLGGYDACNTTRHRKHKRSLKPDTIIF